MLNQFPFPEILLSVMNAMEVSEKSFEKSFEKMIVHM